MLTTERSAEDQKPLTFSWPASGVEITATVSVDSEPYVATAGAVQYLSSEDDKHYYQLLYDAADRPIGEGTARYRMTSGSIVRKFLLNVTACCAETLPSIPPSTGGGCQPVPGDVGNCLTQNQTAAVQTVIDGCPVLPKLQCHEVQQGQDARLLWDFKNIDGEAVNLVECNSQCSESSQSIDEEFDAIGTPQCTVELRMREITGNCAQDQVFVIPVEIINAASGQVRAEGLPEALMRAPGVYIEEWGVFTPDSRMLFSNQCCTFVRRGLFGLSSNPAQRNLGPPTIEEIRLSLRDNAAADNLLLDAVEFDAAEIAQAVTRPINYWNEIPPPLRPVQTTKTFPFREMWLLGIQAYLLEIAAHNYRRNQLSYNAGGIAVDDKNKEQPYAAKSLQLLQRFQEMVRAKKIEINTRLFTGSMGSEYSSLFY